MGNILKIANTRFVKPIIYAPVLGWTGNWPFVSTFNCIIKDVANILTGPIAVNWLKQLRVKQTQVAFAYYGLRIASLNDTFVYPVWTLDLSYSINVW